MEGFLEKKGESVFLVRDLRERTHAPRALGAGVKTGGGRVALSGRSCVFVVANRCYCAPRFGVLSSLANSLCLAWAAKASDLCPVRGISFPSCGLVCGWRPNEAWAMGKGLKSVSRVLFVAQASLFL